MKSYEKIYEQFFSLFTSELGKIKEMHLTCDDEKANHIAFVNVFRRSFDAAVDVNLCSWHSQRNVNHHLAAGGHANLYKKSMKDYDPSFEKQYKMIKYLYLLPEESIIVAVKYLKSRSNDNLQDLRF